jgi:hypothetical protein
VLLTAVAFLCFAAGCATPIGVNHVDRTVAYHSFTANAISAERASSFSARELINFNLYQEFEDNPKKALADLHSGLAPKGDEDRIFALAELSFLHAQNSGERSYYLAAAVYAYAFVIPGQRGTPPRGIDPRLRWAVDFYNQALTKRPSQTKARTPSRWAASSSCPSARLRSHSTSAISYGPASA